jgi:hypothetical protein
MTTRDPEAKKVTGQGKIFRRYLKKGGKSGAWEKLLSYYCPDGKCLSCGHNKPLEIDHVIPVSFGGLNELWNIQPLCSECNSDKSQRIIDFRPDGGRYAASLDPKTAGNRGMVNMGVHEKAKERNKVHKFYKQRNTEKMSVAHTPKLEITDSVGSPQITFSDVSIAFICPICGREHYAYNRAVERECGNRFVLNIELKAVG